jgi:hypothetical protein
MLGVQLWRAVGESHTYHLPAVLLPELSAGIESSIKHRSDFHTKGATSRAPGRADSQIGWQACPTLEEPPSRLQWSADIEAAMINIPKMAVNRVALRISRPPPLMLAPVEWLRARSRRRPVSVWLYVPMTDLIQSIATANCFNSASTKRAASPQTRAEVPAFQKQCGPSHQRPQAHLCGQTYRQARNGAAPMRGLGRGDINSVCSRNASRQSRLDPDRGSAEPRSHRGCISAPGVAVPDSVLGPLRVREP